MMIMIAMTSKQIAAISVLAALLTSSCSWISLEPPATARHLVLVTIDTLRADRAGSYGNKNVATPHNRLAKESAMAPDATVHAPLTRPSHVSLFTGLLPSQHSIRDNVSPPVDDQIPVLAEVLKTAGFSTAAFVSSVVLEAQSGLTGALTFYSDEFEGVDGDDARFLNPLQKRGDTSTSEALAWLGSRKNSEGLFTWIHLYDPHDPYEPPEKTSAETLIPLLHFGWSDLRSLRKGQWKYIEAPRPELYDLEKDPMERISQEASTGSRSCWASSIVSRCTAIWPALYWPPSDTKNRRFTSNVASSISPATRRRGKDSRNAKRPPVILEVR